MALVDVNKFFLLHCGLYEKNFCPIGVNINPNLDCMFVEVKDLKDAMFFTDKWEAEKCRQLALEEEFGTNWYDSDIVVVKLNGKLNDQLDRDDFNPYHIFYGGHKTVEFQNLEIGKKSHSIKNIPYIIPADV